MVGGRSDQSSMLKPIAAETRTASEAGSAQRAPNPTCAAAPGMSHQGQYSRGKPLDSPRRARKTSVRMGSARHLHHASHGHLAICAATNSPSTWITLTFVNQNLCRRPVPRPKFSRSHSTTAAAAPATLSGVSKWPVKQFFHAVAERRAGAPDCPPQQQNQASESTIYQYDRKARGDPEAHLGERAHCRTVRPSFRARRSAERSQHDEYDYRQRWHSDLFQGLGHGPGCYFLAWLAIECRCVGRPDALSRSAGLSRRSARSSRSRSVGAGILRE